MRGLSWVARLPLLTQARFFTFALRDARRSGLDLPKDKRDEVRGYSLNPN
jgi:hypothetical protein